MAVSSTCNSSCRMCLVAMMTRKPQKLQPAERGPSCLRTTVWATVLLIKRVRQDCHAAEAAMRNIAAEGKHVCGQNAQASFFVARREVYQVTDQ